MILCMQQDRIGRVRFRSHRMPDIRYCEAIDCSQVQSSVEELRLEFSFPVGLYSSIMLVYEM
jgi:hypothetical protein